MGPVGDGCGQAKEAVQKAKKMPGGDKANPDLTWVIQLCSGWSFKRERERLSPKSLLWDPGVHLTAWHLPLPRGTLVGLGPIVPPSPMR